MRFIARCPTKTDLEFTFLRPESVVLDKIILTKYSRSVFMLVHNIPIEHHDIRELSVNNFTKKKNHTINHVHGTDKTIHNQPDTMFPQNISNYSCSMTLAFST